MFHKASIRLAAFYLLIIMAISLFFNLNLYQLSVQEFDRGFRRSPNGSALNRPGLQNEPSENTREQILSERENDFQNARNRVIQRLLFTNLIILIGGGVLSYYLAKRTLQPIEEAQEAQSRFTADASHELRTPIAAMQSEIEVALMDPKLTIAQAKKQLKSNLEELSRLTALSEGLLKLANEDQKEIIYEHVSVEDIILESTNRLLPLAEKKGILIISPESITEIVHGDRQSLCEVMVILLDNAIKYSPENTEIEISCQSNAKTVVISIIDKGIGIKASEIPHLFERFYRADSARSKRNTSGYGLGLSIAKSIIDHHKGTITVQSNPGKGSTFSLQLPRVK